MVEWINNEGAGRVVPTGAVATAWWVYSVPFTIVRRGDEFKIIHVDTWVWDTAYPTLEAAKVAYLMLMSITT